MKKKIMFLILVLFFLTGCEINYNLDINGTNLVENVSIYTDGEDINQKYNSLGDQSYKNIIENYMSSSINAYYDEIQTDGDTAFNPNNAFYSKELINTPYNYGIKLNYGYGLQTYYRSNSVKSCYKDLSVSKNNNIVKLLASNNICFDNYALLNKIIVNVKYDGTVIYNDADSLANNTYTWIINKTNYKTKRITFYYDISNKQNTETPKPSEPENPTTDNKKNDTLIILLLFLVFIMVILLIIKAKKKKL